MFNKLKKTKQNTAEYFNGPEEAERSVASVCPDCGQFI